MTLFRVCPNDEPESVPASPDSGAGIQEDNADAKSSPRAEQVSSNPVVKEAMELFHGTVTDVKLLKDEENEEIE